MPQPLMQQIEVMTRLCDELVSTQTRIPRFSIDPLVRPANVRVVMTTMYCDDPDAIAAEEIFFPYDDHATEEQWKAIIARAYARLEGRVSRIKNERGIHA